MYVTPDALVEVDVFQSETFVLSRTIHQGCPMSLLFYALAFENLPVLTTCRFLCRGNSKIDEVNKETYGYETVPRSTAITIFPCVWIWGESLASC